MKEKGGCGAEWPVGRVAACELLEGGYLEVDRKLEQYMQNAGTENGTANVELIILERCASVRMGFVDSGTACSSGCGTWCWPGW